VTPERWQRVEKIFHAARAQPAGAREAFLTAACAGDTGLRREVASLLGQPDGTLLRDGAGAAALALLPLQTLQGGRLGSCVIGPLIGRGGMGDVYRARDTRLERDVAVKMLPSSLAAHPDRLARFEREARALAALNHPHIAAIYGIEEGDAGRGLVLELVDGPTLHELLGSGPLPVHAALAYARQMAEALSAAHQKGIVHRDLKPANIKITGSGAIKVLDFGLAKIDAPDTGENVASPTLETSAGVILGTVAYMSPEQARGGPVDKRTDVWAFGCVLYEMLTGTRPFPGESSADVLGAITRADPDWTLLPADTPPRVRDVLRRSLVKDRDRRLHDVADARIEIEEALDAPALEGGASQGQPRAMRAVPWFVAGVMALAAAAATWSGFQRAPASPSGPARVSVALPADVSVFAIGRGSSVAVSPDGRRVVYAGVAGGRRQLYSRLLGDTDHVPIPGTEDAVNPFISPDGRWVGFVDAPGSGSLKRVPINGGPALTVVDSMGDGLDGYGVMGATWSAGDRIVFAAVNPGKRGIWRVSPDGAAPERITTVRPGEGVHDWPQMVPGGRAVLYTIRNLTGFHGSFVVVETVPGGERTVVAERASYGRVVTAGDGRSWLVFAQPEGLRAAPFDLDGLRRAGPPVPVVDGVLTNLSGGAHFSVSDHGLLAYVPGGLDEIIKTPLWVDRSGRATEVEPFPGLGFQYSLSPDGARLAAPNAAGPSRDVWVHDLQRRGTPVRLTSGRVTDSPIWTPDGSRVIYAATGPDVDSNLFWRPADGTGDEERLTTSPNRQHTGSVSPDGTMLAFVEQHKGRSTDIWLMPLDSTRQPRPWLATPHAEHAPEFSPDGRWLAYESNVSGQFEIYVAPTAGGARVAVSSGGGWRPLWSRQGRELYFRSRPSAQGGNMMVVSVDRVGDALKVGPPRVLFPSPYQGEGAVAPDGRFLLLKRPPEGSPSRAIELVFDWFADLAARVPER
jgi:eukaryotic-like serine/threonine-protein kinase